jgi:hypothetical protein
MRVNTLICKKNTLWLLIILLLAGCVQYVGYDQVDPLVKKYFTALQNHDMDTVMAMYSEEFFKAGYPRDAWRKKLNRLTEELGEITGFSFRNKQADSRFSGKFFIYQYDTLHDGKRAQHILTFVQPVDDKEIKLVGHMIKVKGSQF